MAVEVTGQGVREAGDAATCSPVGRGGRWPGPGPPARAPDAPRSAWPDCRTGSPATPATGAQSKFPSLLIVLADKKKTALATRTADLLAGIRTLRGIHGRELAVGITALPTLQKRGPGQLVCRGSYCSRFRWSWLRSEPEVH